MYLVPYINDLDTSNILKYNCYIALMKVLTVYNVGQQVFACETTGFYYFLKLIKMVIT